MKSNLYLINGPLGAGKTTLLKFLLTQDFLTNAHVIENEFASTSIDSEELHDHVAEIETIAGLCICCSTGTELVDALIKLKGSGNPVIIEATGVANSLKLVEKLVANDILDYYDIAQTFFVIDAAEVNHNPTLLVTHKEELEAADILVVTKTDLLDTIVASEIVSALKDTSKGTVIEAANGAFNTELLNTDSHFLNYFAESDSSFVNHDENINYTIIDTSAMIINSGQLEHLWEVLQKTHRLKRMKGNSLDSTSQQWHVEATPAQCIVGQKQGSVASLQLIFIGEDARLITPTILQKALDE